MALSLISTTKIVYFNSFLIFFYKNIKQTYFASSFDLQIQLHEKKLVQIVIEVTVFEHQKRYFNFEWHLGDFLFRCCVNDNQPIFDLFKQTL